MLKDSEPGEIIVQEISCMIISFKYELLNESLIFHLPLNEGNSYAAR
jgi:hypothetical protein